MTLLTATVVAPEPVMDGFEHLAEIVDAEAHAIMLADLDGPEVVTDDMMDAADMLGVSLDEFAELMLS